MFKKLIAIIGHPFSSVTWSKLLSLGKSAQTQLYILKSVYRTGEQYSTDILLGHRISEERCVEHMMVKYAS